MIKGRRWAFWRRMQYGLLFLVLGIGLFSGFIFLVYEDGSNCFDSKQNGTETAVDCGGICVRICAADVFPPRVVWASSFEIVEGQYNAVAYVENLNETAATERLVYTFTLFNGSDIVAQRSGETVLPPDRMYPVFEGRISTNDNPVTHTEIVLEPVAVWQPAEAGPEQFAIRNIVLSQADVRPRLDVNIENTAVQPSTEVEVVTTLFNEAGKPLTASQTFIDVLPGREARDIVFTWPQPIAKTVRSCLVPSDVVVALDLSGSMNNDNPTPPQPLTDAKIAAEDFVKRLTELDMASLVTFASDAMINVPLTNDKMVVADAITELTISPSEETGYTNTLAALEQIKAELSSLRHNKNARRAAVLLTDGLPTSANQNESELTIAAAQLAQQMQDSGVTFYAIGLGENVDRTFIEGLVDDRSQAYFAPTGADLGAIYEQVTSDLCESGTTRIDVIPKTKANFIPLH